MTPAAIRALRLKLGLSQAVFAFWFCVSPSTVRRWETGAASPRARSTIALLRLQRHYQEKAEGPPRRETP